MDLHRTYFSPACAYDFLLQGRSTSQLATVAKPLWSPRVARHDVRYRSLPLLAEMADGFGAPRYGLASYCGPSPFSHCEKWAHLRAGFPLCLFCVGPLLDRYLFFSTHLPLRSILLPPWLYCAIFGAIPINQTYHKGLKMVY